MARDMAVTEGLVFARDLEIEGRYVEYDGSVYEIDD